MIEKPKNKYLIYYHLGYEKERELREKFQGPKSAEYGIVLNSLANVRGCLKNDFEYGLSHIQECIQIYEQSIGEMNQNYMIALDWNGWYLFKLKRFDEAVIIWEKAIRLAYQIFGQDYYIYKNLRDSNLWSLYAEFDILERIRIGYIEYAEENMIAGDKKNAKDMCFVGIQILDKLKDNNTKKYNVDEINRLRERLVELQDKSSK